MIPVNHNPANDVLHDPPQILTQEDGRMRYESSFIKYFGQAVAVRGVDQTLRMNVHEPIKDIVYLVNANSVNLDIASPQLGFLNAEGTAYYVTRIPKRRGKQGLDSHNTLLYPLTEYPDQHNLFDFNSKLIANCINGTYTHTVNDFLRRRDSVSLGFSRDIALMRLRTGLIKVYYKTKFIGILKEDNRTVSLFPEYQYTVFINSVLAVGLGI